jgi:hypothetical protein
MARIAADRESGGLKTQSRAWQTIKRVTASDVGRDDAVAGSDCGFATLAGSPELHPSLV